MDSDRDATADEDDAFPNDPTQQTDSEEGSSDEMPPLIAMHDDLVEESEHSQRHDGPSHMRADARHDPRYTQMNAHVEAATRRAMQVYGQVRAQPPIGQTHRSNTPMPNEPHISPREEAITIVNTDARPLRWAIAARDAMSSMYQLIRLPYHRENSPNWLMREANAPMHAMHLWARISDEPNTQVIANTDRDDNEITEARNTDEDTPLH